MKKLGSKRVALLLMLSLFSFSNLLLAQAPNCEYCEEIRESATCEGDFACDEYQDCIAYCNGIPVDGGVVFLLLIGLGYGV